MNGKRILSATLRLLGLAWVAGGIGVIALTIFYATARQTVDFSDRKAVNEFTGWLGMLLIVTAPGLGFWFAGKGLLREESLPNGGCEPPPQSLSKRRVIGGVLGALLMGFAGFVACFVVLPMFGLLVGGRDLAQPSWGTAIFALLGMLCGMLMARK